MPAMAQSDPPPGGVVRAAMGQCTQCEIFCISPRSIKPLPRGEDVHLRDLHLVRYKRKWPTTVYHMRWKEFVGRQQDGRCSGRVSLL